jgi:hypothetical protein
VDPALHLTFDRIGQVHARRRSDRGQATIRTCGLDRESLRSARYHTAADTYRHSQRLLVAVNKGDRAGIQNAIEDLLSLGDEKRAHAGVVRSIVMTVLGCKWDQLRVLSKEFDVSHSRRRGSKMA